MPTNDLYDPGLHLFVDDAELQDYPGFTRKIQQPRRHHEPVLLPDMTWEGNSIELWGSVLYDPAGQLFKMWYFAIDFQLQEAEGVGHNMCYATSPDGIEWTKPELGIVENRGSSANNIVFPTPEMPAGWGADPWGVVLDPDDDDPAQRYKFGFFQTRPASPTRERPGMDDDERRAIRKIEFAENRDRHGMCAAFSPDGIHWTLCEDVLVPRGGDAGTLVYDPMGEQYIATTRRYNCITDHFVLEWKQYRRVAAMSTSKDFVTWSPLTTRLKPDDLDDRRDQIYVMTPFAYGNQYLGFVGMLESATELGPVYLASARDLEHWQRVGRRDLLFPTGPPGSWDAAWATMSGNPPVLVDDTLYVWYTGNSQAHGTRGDARSRIGLATLRKDGFVALRCGIRGAQLMTEPVTVSAPKLFLNATCEFGRVRVRVIDDFSVAEGYDFDDCQGLERADEVSFEITYGKEGKDLSPFVNRQVRLHIEAENAASLYSYRFGN